MSNDLKAWSISRYHDYQLCPRQFELKHIRRIKEPLPDTDPDNENPLELGSRIHDLAERYIQGHIEELPPELSKFADTFERLRAAYEWDADSMVVEDMWAFTREWDETDWNAWNACWVRIKLDCAHHEDETTLVITDWKTGKYRDFKNAQYAEQLELYALGALLLHPHIETVKPRLVYLDVGIIYPQPGTSAEADLTFTRKDIPKLQKLWERRVRPMFSDTMFSPRPNKLCRYCYYRKENREQYQSDHPELKGQTLCDY